MKVQAKNLKPKIVARRGLHEGCDKLELIAESEGDTQVLLKLFRVFMKVGGAGMNLIMDEALERIQKCEQS